MAALIAVALIASLAPPVAGSSHPSFWESQWPDTDFNKHTVSYDEIMSGGPPKDGIPSIDDPRFVPVAEATDLKDSEPVVGLVINGEAKAYPLRILTWHEIVNDEIAGVPVTVTFCPLCNSSIVFDRRVEEGVLDFGTTGKLRNSDLVMYDRQTESWWQQFTGKAIVGDLVGRSLTMIPSRLESWASFRARTTDGQVLVPNNPGMRDYGRNPYVGYDSAPRPFLYRGDMPEGIPPMVRVIAVGDTAWSLPLLRDKGEIRAGELTIRWQPGMNSALDDARIDQGRDIGNVIVQRETADGTVDIVHDVTFAFVFHAFRPAGTIHHL